MTIRVAFLCSGGGGNLKLLYTLARRGALPLSISCVIADRECAALDWARARDIESAQLAYTRSQADALHGALSKIAPDLIITTVHKILDDGLVAKYEGRLVNLHYSLLPAFAGSIGMESARRARAQGCRLIGATSHRVTEHLDAGPILAQACVVDDPNQPESALNDAVFRCGGVALAAAMDGICESGTGSAGGALRAGELSIFAAPLPRSEVCDIFSDEAYWESLR